MRARLPLRLIVCVTSVLRRVFWSASPELPLQRLSEFPWPQVEITLWEPPQEPPSPTMKQFFGDAPFIVSSPWFPRKELSAQEILDIFNPDGINALSPLWRCCKT